MQNLLHLSAIPLGASIFAVRPLLVVRSPFHRDLCQANHSFVPYDDESLVEPVFDGESGVTGPGDDDAPRAPPRTKYVDARIHGSFPVKTQSCFLLGVFSNSVA